MSNKSQVPSKENSNPNSLMVLFDKERDSISGVDRVFKKSLFILIAFLASFLWLVTVSLNLLTFNIAITFLSIAVFIAVSNLFYILVADRSYVWLSLLGQVVILVAANSFLGLGFTIQTWVITLLMILFTYLAYTELEKVQLSSRLFSISQITAESTRVLSLAVIFLFALGIFNTIIAQGYVDGKNYGSGKFIDKTFLQNNWLMKKYIIGDSKNLSLNHYLMSGNSSGSKLYQDTQNGKIVYEFSSKTGTVVKQATFGDFLEFNYKNGEVLLSDKEIAGIVTEKCDGQATTEACVKLIATEKTNRLEAFRKDSYSGLALNLDTLLTMDNFKEITRQFYLNRVSDFENTTSQDGSLIPQNLIIIPINQVIPAVFAVLLFIALFVVKFLMNFFAFIFSWIFWQILVATGFVQIEVETVEAEIVSI